MYAFFVWVGKSLLILLIFHFLLPSVVHTHTRNSWVKIPLMVVLACAAGFFMTWMQYVPYLLVFVWLAVTRGTIGVMEERWFQRDAGFRINPKMFYWSSYLYVILSCLLAWFLQAEISPHSPAGPWIPLWKHLLGLG